MRKSLIGLLTLFLLLVLTASALAATNDINLNINGKPYQPVSLPQLQEGTTMVPVYLVGRVLGADISTSDQTISIKKNGRTLTLTLGSVEANLDGQVISLPQAPARVNSELMVPLRVVADTFGASVDWQAQTQTVAVHYREKRQGMSAEELLAKSGEALGKFNTYKTRVDMTQHMEVANPKKAGEKEKLDVTMHTEMAQQKQPLLAYGRTRTTFSGPTKDAGNPGGMESEVLINEQGVYTTMPGQGWVKMSIPGVDLKALLEQSRGQDPLNSLQQLKEAGVIMSLGDDRQKNGRSYWIVNVTMGADSLSRLMQEMMAKLSLPPDKNAEQFLKNIIADAVYTVWINQDTFLPDYMDVDSNIRINVQLPVADTQDQPIMVDMAMKQTGTCEIFDPGVPFTAPDVSQAVDFNDLIKNSPGERQ